jgi:hypothetical protein
MHRGRGRRVGKVVDWLDGSMTERSICEEH